MNNEKENFKSKTSRLEIRLDNEMKTRLDDISKSINVTKSKLLRQLLENLIEDKEKLLEIYSKKTNQQDEIENFVENTFDSYLNSVSACETKAESILYLRQSIKNDNYRLRYDRMSNTLEQFSKNMGYKNTETVFYQDLSGFFSYEEVVKFLKADSVKAIFISEITRLSRNIEAYLTIVNYAYKNHKKIYLNNTDITSGSGYITGLVQAIFAEMELLSKQTSFSKYMLEVAKFLNKTIIFDQIQDKKARKLVTLAKFEDREVFIKKMIDKAINVLEDNKYTEKLKTVAKTVLIEFGVLK